MPALNHLFTRAIQFSKAGKKEDARRLLGYILSQEPLNEAAWLWYADTFDSPGERKLVLQKLQQINPSNRYALHGLEKLRSIPAASPNLPLPAQAAKTPPRSAPASRRAEALGWWGGFFIIVGAGLFLAAAFFFGLNQYRQLLQRYETLSSQHLQLGDQYIKLERDTQKLSVAYQDLSTRHQDLSTQYQELSVRHRDLTTQYQDLTSQHKQLLDEYQVVSGKYQALTSQFDKLNLEYADLSGKYSALTGKYAKLDQEAVKPPYIWIHDRKVVVTFYRLDQQLLYWSMPFETLENAITWGNALRADPPTVVLRNNDGQRSRVNDVQKYADPHIFEHVIPPLYWKIDDPETFIRQAWYIVAQLSHWKEEEGDIPRTPLETLLAGGGDCEDLAILFASMIRAAPVDWKVDLVMMDTTNLDNPVAADHVIVYIEHDGHTHFIETTSTSVMEPYTEGVSGWHFEVK